MCHQSNAPTVVATDLFCHLNDLGVFYFIGNRFEWRENFRFDSCVFGPRTLLTILQNVELFSNRISDWTEYSYMVSAC